MRILLVCNGYPPNDTGGIQEYVYSITQQLKKTDEVCIFTREYNQARQNFSKRTFRDDNVTIISVVNNNVLPQNFIDSYINKEIDVLFEQIIQEFKPDIIHYNHFIGLSSNLPSIAKKYKIPMLFTLHDFWYMCPCIRLVTLSGEPCKGGNPACVKDYFQQNPKFLSIMLEKSPLVFKRLIPFSVLIGVRSMFASINIVSKNKSVDDLTFNKLIRDRKRHFKKILNHSNTFIAPSKYVKEKYTDFGINARKIVLLPHGINVKEIKQNLHKQKSKTVRFAYLGTLSTFKGIDVLIKAFDMLKNKKVDLKIYGDPKINPPYYRKLRKLSGKKNIHFMGGYKRPDLNKVFSSIDVVIIPSTVPESFNLVAYEAQAAKIPVIASRIGALKEVVNKRNCLLFTPGNAKELAQAMSKLIDSPDLIKKFSRNAKIPLDLESHVSKLLRIYKRIIKNNK